MQMVLACSLQRCRLTSAELPHGDLQLTSAIRRVAGADGQAASSGRCATLRRTHRGQNRACPGERAHFHPSTESLRQLAGSHSHMLRSVCSQTRLPSPPAPVPSPCTRDGWSKAAICSGHMSHTCRRHRTPNGDSSCESLVGSTLQLEHDLGCSGRPTTLYYNMV